jgi:hypothetical protein
MIAFILFTVVSLTLLCVRLVRTIRFYNASNSLPLGHEKSIAYRNFIIHLLTCIVLLVITTALIYNIILGMNGEV